MLNYDAGWDAHCARLEREEALEEARREEAENPAPSDEDEPLTEEDTWAMDR